jgi:hypothetical protein
MSAAQQLGSDGAAGGYLVIVVARNPAEKASGRGGRGRLRALAENACVGERQRAGTAALGQENRPERAETPQNQTAAGAEQVVDRGLSQG